MSVPVWVLLGFAGWTVAVLLGSVGVYRWSLILSGRRRLSEFNPEDPRGADWYRRAMRAHMNCVENLPVYGAIVVAMVVAGVQGPWLDTLALVFLGARIVQTVVHVGFPMTDWMVGIRFSFFFTQLVCMVGMGTIVVLHA